MTLIFYQYVQDIEQSTSADADDLNYMSMLMSNYDTNQNVYNRIKHVSCYYIYSIK